MMCERTVKDKTVVVVGAGVSGVCAAELCLKMGAKEVRLLDRDMEVLKRDGVKNLIKKGIEVFTGEHERFHFDSVDLVVLSPGVLKRKIEHFLEDNVPVISELELGFWFLDSPVIAITGTNGKTTTSSLIAHVFDKRFKVFLGGNIGVPLCAYVLSGEKADVVVLEVSSFQLQNILYFRPHVALFLNFSLNHLDFHKDEDEYFNSKLNLFKNQTPDDFAVIEEKLLDKILKHTNLSSKVIAFDNRGRFDYKVLLGEHNQKNIEAAFICCNIFGIEEDEFRESLKSFTPHPHRLQVFLNRNNILFVDDSKATTLSAMEAAIKSFSRKVILLAGGRFKGGDPFEVRPILKQKVKKAVLFGECRRLFFNAWKDVCAVIELPDLGSAVKEAIKIAEPGDVVLLSPATSSFDEFKNYVERGTFFQQKVKELMGVDEKKI